MLNRSHPNTQFQRHGNRGQCIQHIVTPRHVEADVEGSAIGSFHPEPGAQTLLPDGNRPQIRLRGGAIGQYRASQFIEQGTHFRVVDTEHCQTVKGEMVQKLDKGLAEAIEIPPIGRHMICIDIGHYRQHRLQIEE